MTLLVMTFTGVRKIVCLLRCNIAHAGLRSEMRLILGLA